MKHHISVEHVRPRIHAGLYHAIQFFRRRPIALQLSRLKKWERLEPSTYRDHCHQRLKRALNYAKAHVPLYRSGPWAKARPDRLESWPVLGRALAQERAAELFALPRKSGVVYRRSSASTGKPMLVPWNPAAAAWNWSSEHRAMQWHGVPIGVNAIMVWGVEEPLVNRVLNRHFFPARHLTVEQLEAAAQCLLRHRRVLCYAYPSVAAQLARYVGMKYPEARKPLLQYAKIGGEQVFTFHREEIRRYLGAKVVEFYGCAEVGAIAAECPHGSMHIFAPHTHVEIFHGDQPAPPGEFGDIVVTSLGNRAAPYIRYRNGDRGRLAVEPCSCGLPNPVLAELQGRAGDDLLAADGRHVHGSMIGRELAKYTGRPPLGSARQVLFEQIDQVNWQVHVEADQTDERQLGAQVRDVVHSLFGKTCHVRVRRTTFIPREPSGKFRYYRRALNGAIAGDRLPSGPQKAVTAQR